MSFSRVICIACLLLPAAGAAAQVSNLTAEARNGQVFLTWQEADTPAGTTFNVYASSSQITDLSQSRLLAHHIEQRSARDWWEDPASFKKESAPCKPVGFIIRENGTRLDPAGGLFVHTITPADGAKLFFAVAAVDPAGKPDSRCEIGQNSLPAGVDVHPADIQPIWQTAGAPPPAGAGNGKPMWLQLHAKGGGVPSMEYLVFGDGSMGWREGLPFKFSARVEADGVVVRPTDRVWINRPHNEASDGGTPAIWTFWYGYNANIFDRKLMEKGVIGNFTEHRNLYILDWVRGRFNPDPARWYCSGSSMGGCGTISFGLRHPELFAALHAHVPIVSYTYLGRGSAVRFEPSCWTGRIPDDLKTTDGQPLLQHHDGVRYVSQSAADLPMLFLENGRQDGSIPWQNNPPFYRAMQEARQPFAAWWDNGTHSTSGKTVPPDVKAWQERFRLIRADQSIPAFSHSSSDRNPGNGDPADGDITGWINRGMNWKDIDDAADHYAITLTADYPGVQYPVTTDVTFRRRQKFKPAANQSLKATIGAAAPIDIHVTATGQITLPSVSIPGPQGVRVTLEPAK